MAFYESMENYYFKIYQEIKKQTNLDLAELEYLKGLISKALTDYKVSNNQLRRNADGEHLTDFSHEIADLEARLMIIDELEQDIKEKAETEYLTTKQKILVFHYLFKHMGIDESTELRGQKRSNAEFIMKVLGLKGIENYKNSYTYKILKNPLNESRSELQEIRNLFENIGLSEIAENITKDLKV